MYVGKRRWLNVTIGREWPRECNRLSGLFGYSQKPVRLNSNLALLGKIDYWICSIRNNRFVHLHSEVLRYSSSASTIRPLFEYIQFYDDIRICVYDITCKSITTSNLKCNVNVTVVTINIYVGTRLKPCTGSKILANMQPDLPLHGVTTRVMTTDSSSYK